MKTQEATVKAAAAAYAFPGLAGGAALAGWIAVGVAALACTSPRFACEAVLGFGFTGEFLAIARGLAETSTFCFAGPLGCPSEVLREPAYPALLAISGVLDGSCSLLWWMQVALVGSAAGMMAALASKTLGLLPAAIVLVLTAACPTVEFYAAVAYPYAGHVFLLALFFLLLEKATEGGSTMPAALAGVVLGAASYERGALLLLGAWLVTTLILLRRLPARAGAALLTMQVAVVSPWIVRNSRHGVLGMNGMFGYAIGYAYGDLPAAAPPQDASATLYRQFLAEKGADAGSLQFLRQGQANGTPFVELDRSIRTDILPRMRSQPRAVLIETLKSAAVAASRLTPTLVRGPAPVEAHFRAVRRIAPTPIDLVIAVLGLFGLAWEAWRRDVLSALLLATLVYLVLANGLITKFDPRYRSMVGEFALYFGATAAVLIAWRAGRSRAFGSRRDAVGPLSGGMTQRDPAESNSTRLIG